MALEEPFFNRLKNLPIGVVREKLRIAQLVNYHAVTDHEGLLHCLQDCVSYSSAEPDITTPQPLIPFQGQFCYYPPIFAYVSRGLEFLLKCCMHFLFFITRATCLSISPFYLLALKYLLKYKNYGTPYCALFSTLLSLP